jgi:NADH:ubiquinone oxidoreductase subunit E
MPSKTPSKTLDQILEERRSQPSQLIEVLQDVQENYGYISEEAMHAAAEGLGVPLMEVYRVASFYGAFKLKPCGRNHLIMCMGTACHVRGARLVSEQAVGQFGVNPGEVTPDGAFSVEHVNCLGACALGPIVREDGSYHHHMTPAKLRKLIEALRRQGTEGIHDVQTQ